MSDVAIRIENLGKQYRIGGKQMQYKTFRETLTGMFDIPLRHLSRYAKNESSETIWALKNITFDVKQGEVLGIIGHNGAGKSTLLKILSRTTEPTEGVVYIRGRMGSLLEVGTGFHPELTGRENIYLNGSILGMKRTEINRKFDEIVAFAEVDKFIDTPVKRYSSGMYLRLAFAVAAHLDPEILIVDEVLAVGDAAFQKKCLNKMGEVAQQGRTVIFVSHNMSVVSNLCTFAYCLDSGRLNDAGAPADVIRHYLAQNQAQQENDLTAHPGRTSKSKSLMRRIRLRDDQAVTSTFHTMGSFRLEVECHASPEELRKFTLGFTFKDSLGTSIFGSNTNQYGLSIVPNDEGHVKIQATIETLFLAPGGYSISLYLGNGSYDIDIVEDAIYFDVIWVSQEQIAYPPRPYWGWAFAPVRWSHSGKDSNSE